MESLDHLTALLQTTTADVEARESFDKQALLENHNFVATGVAPIQSLFSLTQRMEATGASPVAPIQSHFSVTDLSSSSGTASLIPLERLKHDLTRQQMEATGASPVAPIQSHFSLAGSSGTASTIPLERLKPISLTQLHVGNTHHGRVLYGTLCAEAYSVSSIMTVLEDDNGLAIRLAIYDVPHSQTNIERLYPKGAKVAIREPHYMRGLDDSPIIYVDYANVEMLVTQNDKRAEAEEKDIWSKARKRKENRSGELDLVSRRGTSRRGGRMESPDHLMALLQTTTADVEARESFDKQALLENHNFVRQRSEATGVAPIQSLFSLTQRMEATGASPVAPIQSHFSVTDLSSSSSTASLIPLERLKHDLTRQQMEATGASPVAPIQSHFSLAGSSGTASTIPLERLKPISLTQLHVGNTHHGRVLYGTLCAEAYSVSSIMTVLEDDNGLAIRLAIYDVPHSQTNIERLYPKGAKVAIREPHYMRGLDDSPIIYVDYANVEMLVTQNDKRAAAEEERKKGNSCFRHKQWEAAADHYTNCIDAALLQLKNGSSNDDHNMDILLHTYSIRAETRLQVKKYELALEDCDKALAIDSGSLMALYRKGRALAGLSRYEAACESLEKADKASPGQKKIQDVLHEAKTLYSQNPIVENDISDFLLGFGPPPEVDDFVGPVEIKMTEDGRGRGLYATREIFIGQFLMVCNAIAVTYEDRHSPSPTLLNMTHWGNINMASQKHLVAAVLCAAKKSQILLRQLYTLDDSSLPGNLDVPPIDLFKRDGQMSGSQEKEKETLLVNVNRIRAIISRNSFSGAEPSKSKMYEAKLIERGQNFSGLWLLPSFINHSCLPNSSILKVGSAMFIHASKPINSGEEITISYFDTLVPLPQRQDMCERRGFECKCRRCILELSLKADMEPITTRFQELHDKALKEITAAKYQERFEADLPACAEFEKLYEEGQEIVRNSALLIAQEEENWIRASFVSAYLLGTRWNVNFFTMTLTDCVPSGQEVMDAIQDTVPGDIRTLVMAAQKLKDATCLMGDESKSFITRYASEQAREACIRVFGRHSEDVQKALVLQHSNCHDF